VKPLALIVAAVIGAFAAIAFAPGVAPSGPVPIAHGRDACASCRMHVDRPGYAAERLVDGRVAIYDDLGCLAHALAAGGERGRIWVEDHASGALVPLESATLVRARDVRTPMGSGVVAFRDASGARGEPVTLERLEVSP
jgi:hypothetical protein